MIRILGLDDTPQMVMLHPGAERMAPDELKPPEGVAGIYDLSVGRYDVTVSVGPSYQSRRQESVDALIRFVEAL